MNTKLRHIYTLALLISLCACSEPNFYTDMEQEMAIGTSPTTTNIKFNENDEIGMFAYENDIVYETIYGVKLNNIKATANNLGNLIIQTTIPPLENDLVDIFAYYPYYSAISATTTNEIINLPILQDQSTLANFNKSDALVASKNGVNSETIKTLDLEFEHIHAKLNFKFKIGEGFNNIDQIKDLKIKIGGIPTKVKYNIATKKTTPDFTSKIELTPHGKFIRDDTDTNNKTIKGVSVIVPAYAYDATNPLSVLITNGTSTYTAKLTETIETGKYYDITYTLKWSSNVAPLSAEITGWESGDSVDADATIPDKIKTPTK